MPSIMLAWFRLSENTISPGILAASVPIAAQFDT